MELDQTIFLDAVPIPVKAGLGEALLGGVVYVNDAKAAIIAVGPFKVVEKAPKVVAEEGVTFLDGAVGGLQVLAQIVDAVEVEYFALGGEGILSGAAIFGDYHRQGGAVEGVADVAHAPVEAIGY